MDKLLEHAVMKEIQAEPIIKIGNTYLKNMENVLHDLTINIRRNQTKVQIQKSTASVRAQHPVHMHSQCQSLRALSSVPVLSNRMQNIQRNCSHMMPYDTYTDFACLGPIAHREKSAMHSPWNLAFPKPSHFSANSSSFLWILLVLWCPPVIFALRNS